MVPTSPELCRARALRAASTLPERLLWGKLRDRRLAGWRFKQQVPVGRFVADFLCPDAKLVIELDGGQHSEDEVARRDAERTRDLERLGFRVIRFWNGEVTGDLASVCETILADLEGGRVR